MNDIHTNITKALMGWYPRVRRDLPWRRTQDPYAIWVSEVMLQQTRVDTVIPYYHRFLDRFPTPVHLADADADAVLKLWEGLGYYARARNLQAAVRRVVDEFGARVPDDPGRFRSLPGAGEYITAAVQSIAFGHPLAVVDGNVKRVLARLFALEGPINRAATVRTCKELAQSLLDETAPGDFNQAIMELGATVCTPRQPSCAECPVADWCAARASGRVDELPRRDPRRAVPRRHVAVGVVEYDGRVLITKRPDAGLLGGLWEFPGGKVRGGESAEAACRREILEEVSLDVEVVDHLARVRHAYTHFKVELDVYRCQASGREVTLSGPVDHRWITLEEIDEYAFPRANHKFIPVLKEELTKK